MIQIFDNEFVPKYHDGRFVWDRKSNRPEFEIHDKLMLERSTQLNINGYEFKSSINQLEEQIYRQNYQRVSKSLDSDVIILEDIKNLALFLAPSNLLTKRIIKFMHTPTIDRLLRALIIYFEYFLKITEYIMIERNDVAKKLSKIQTNDNFKRKLLLSKQLIQYRIMIAREYSSVILGNEELHSFYHLDMTMKISKKAPDCKIHEGFLALCTQIVWIAHHRRAFDHIDMEIGRLFRSDHFLLKNYQIKFTPTDAFFLYGSNYKISNCRKQNSPLILELKSINEENLPLLWIGTKKYHGYNKRIYQLELEYLVPDAQLQLINVDHGILGHPKKLYNTMLEIEWQAVREQNYSLRYDPYHLLTQPSLHIPSPKEDLVEKYWKRREALYNVKPVKDAATTELNLDKWLDRDKVIGHYTSGRDVLQNVWRRCEEEIKSIKSGRTTQEIITEFTKTKTESHSAPLTGVVSLIKL